MRTLILTFAVEWGTFSFPETIASLPWGDCPGGTTKVPASKKIRAAGIEAGYQAYAASEFA